MSFLGPPFEHDVFVSYAHGRGGNLLRWSHCLIETLENDILDLETEFDDLDVFIDLELDPTKPLTKQLRGKVQKSGLLLVIMSKRYLESDWCQKEIEWFEAEIKACQEAGGLVLVVRVQPTNHEEWPSCLKDEDGHTLIGFTFHPKGGNGDEMVRPHGWPEPLPTDREYYRELGKLSTIITRRLNELKKRPTLRANANQARQHNPIDEKPGIYLQAAASEIDVWRLTKQVMEASGYRVFPDALPIVDRNVKAIQEARKKRLQLIGEKANALCLLGSRESNGQDQEIEAIANDRIALQAFGKDLPVAVRHRGEGKPTLAREFGIDAIDAAGDDWLIRFQGWLQQALAAETAS